MRWSRLFVFIRSDFKTNLIAGAPLMSGERRCRREDKSAFSTNVRSIALVVLLSSIGISVILLSTRYDRWTPLQLEMAP
jgi:hypothetical protein